MQTRDLESLFNDVYSKIVPRHFGYLHGFLLSSLESHLRRNGTLLVLGPGGNVLPYSCQYTEDGKLGQSNRGRIKRMVGNGRIVLADYVLKFDESGLEKERDVLSKMGFFDEGYFSIGAFNPEGILDPTSVGERTISFPAVANACIGGSILDEYTAIHLSRHAAQIIKVLRVHDCRVPETMFNFFGQINSGVGRGHPDDRHDGHHLL